VPAPVEEALRRVLAKAPMDRFSTAEQFAQALVPRASALERPPKRHHRGGSPARRWLVAGGGAVVVAVAVTVVLLTRPAPSTELDRNLVAVMPFVVASGDPALSGLDADMVELFWMKLSGDEGPQALAPGAVLKASELRGGSLTDEEALAIAQRLGAGRVVQGGVGGVPSHIELTAIMREVPSGRVRATHTVSGRLDYLTALADSLIVALVAGDFGVEIERIPALTRFAPTAVRSYLLARRAMRRFDWEGTCRLVRQALRADSTFALAAMLCFQAGERDTAAARLAWAHRATLSARDQRFLHALAGNVVDRDFHFARKVAEFDTLVALYPGWPDALGEWANALLNYGPAAGIADWAERSQEALEQIMDLGAGTALDGLSLLRVASHRDDTAAVRRAAAVVSDVDAEPKMEDLVHWQLARFLGDTAEIARIRTDMSDADEWTLMYMAGTATVDGRDPEDAEWAVAAMLARQGGGRPSGEVQRAMHLGALLAHARGRYRQWLTDRRRYYGTLPHAEAGAWMVRDALYLGAPEDAEVSMSVRSLERVVRGEGEPPPDTEQLAIAHCWLAQWRLQNGSTVGVEEALGYLREGAPRPDRFATCAALIEYLRAVLDGDAARESALELDSVIRSVPWSFHGDLDPIMGLADVVLTREFRQYGELARALRTARRQRYTAFQGWWVWADQILEEARLATTLGDTTGAIRAYEHYLTLRSDPPDYQPWRAQWDSVRVELAALVAR